MANLPKQQLGWTGLQVTMLAMARCDCVARPDAGPTTEKEAEMFSTPFSMPGSTTSNTSIDYGASEERIGRYISGRRSENYPASNATAWSERPPYPVAISVRTCSPVTTSSLEWSKVCCG